MAKSNLINHFFRKHNLTYEEQYFLEIKLLSVIVDELLTFYKAKYAKYQDLYITNRFQEVEMYGANFMQEIINDILATEEYSLAGIANYTRIPEDVLCDVACGLNLNPTLEVSKRLFELHITVKKELYDRVVNKIMFQE